MICNAIRKPFQKSSHNKQRVYVYIFADKILVVIQWVRKNMCIQLAQGLVNMIKLYTEIRGNRLRSR